MIKILVTFSCWPAAACMYQKRSCQTKKLCQVLLTSQDCTAFVLFLYTALLFAWQCIRSLKNKPIDIMVSFKLSFSFCEFFIIKVGLHISDLDMSIFGIKLFDIYLESKKVLCFIKQEGKWGTSKLLTPLRSTVEQSLNTLRDEYKLGRGLCSFFKDCFLLIIKKLRIHFDIWQN